MTRVTLAAFGPEARIVDVSSTFAQVGGLRGGASSAAEGGLNALTLHLAAPWRDRGRPFVTDVRLDPDQVAMWSQDVP
jgi:NAD(P)-dependent dehydrogenase (short-subunit alcohol dehydrogenase family)